MKLKTRPAKKLSVKLRHEALTTNDQIYLRRFKRLLAGVLSGVSVIMEANSGRFLLLQDNHDQIYIHNDLVGLIYMHIYRFLLIPDTDCTLWNRRLNRGIDSFSDEQIKNNFHFQNREQLRMIFRCFLFPRSITLDNGCVVSGEEAFLVTVYRMSWPRKLTQIEEMFGRDYSLWSRCIKHVLNYMVDNWSYLLFDNMAYWLPYLPLMNSKISNKISNRVRS